MASTLADYIRARVAGCVQASVESLRHGADRLERELQRTADPFAHAAIAVEQLSRTANSAAMDLGTALREMRDERINFVVRGNRMASALECALAGQDVGAEELRAALEQWRELVP